LPSPVGRVASAGADFRLLRAGHRGFEMVLFVHLRRGALFECSREDRLRLLGGIAANSQRLGELRPLGRLGERLDRGGALIVGLRVRQRGGCFGSGGGQDRRRLLDGVTANRQRLGELRLIGRLGSALIAAMRSRSAVTAA
jgi:hypothetical protein